MKDPNEKDFSKYDLDQMIKDYSDVGRTKTNNSSAPAQKGEKKKFVVHMDESLIDQANYGEKDTKPSTGGGIYFSNYQKKHRAVNPQYSKINAGISTDGNRNVSKISEQKEEIKNKVKTATKKASRKAAGKSAMGFLVFIVVFTMIFSYIGITCMGDMLAINRNDENVAVSIPAESDYKQIIKILKKNKLIKRPVFCEYFIKFRGFDDETFLSGDYYLNSKMGIEGMMKDIMEEPVIADSITLSFPEGWTISQIAEKLEKNEICKSSQLYSSAKTANYSFDFISEITDSDKRYQKLEGYLFPDTYDFYKDADVNYVIRKFLTNFEKKWEPEYDARAKKLGYTRDEIVTIASILQKEAANAEQMRIISSILHNRLKNPSEYPTLGCDSTAIYVSNYVTPVVGETQGSLFQQYYDTSAVKGLPPGPICNPGMDAIKAALYPDDTSYYYFAHDESGKIYLASNYQEHKNNLVEILKANSR